MNTELFEIIRTTRSMRRLKADPVPAPLIRQILEAGHPPRTAATCRRGGSWYQRPRDQGERRAMVPAWLA